MTLEAQQHLSDSEQAWLNTRRYLRERRTELDRLAADELIDIPKVADSALLTRPEWLPAWPLPLTAIELSLQDAAPATAVTAETARPGLPRRSGGERYVSYSDALGQLAKPGVFENRRTYRLLHADLASARPRLEFGPGSYFDGTDTGEAVGHELAAAQLGDPVDGGVRAAIGDPCDLARRPVNLAVTTLTIRRDRIGGPDTFLLHWRDPAKVGHAGGLHQVVPAGIFQPSGEQDFNVDNDFSLWRNIIRELAEELLGESEADTSHTPIDYSAWPFAAALDRALAEDQVRAYCLGLGVDPTTYAADLLTAVVIDDDVFDTLFGAAVADNDEGTVLAGLPFTPDGIEEVLAERPMQAAGAGLLRLATRHDLP